MSSSTSCHHVMSSGVPCGSPALRGKTHCYYHYSIQRLLPHRFAASETFQNVYDHGVRLYPMPLLEDATSIQTALMQVIHASLEGSLNPIAARNVLWALRLARQNLPAVKLEKPADPVADGAPRQVPSNARETHEMALRNTPDDVPPGEAGKGGKSTCRCAEAIPGS